LRTGNKTFDRIAVSSQRVVVEQKINEKSSNC
jgi:hypothetical protein